MGEIHVDGPTAQAFLQEMLSNDIDRLSDGEAQYTLLTNEAGGIVDDLIAYRLALGQFYLVVNASNRGPVFTWLKDREQRGCEVRDASDEYGLVAVQGPRSLERLGLPEAPAFTHAMGELDGIEVMIARTGYTGEVGVELCCAEDESEALWDAIMARGVTPCGLGARDTLRLEVCYPLHGNDISPETDAISAGLGWACALDSEFTGVGVLRRIKEEGPTRKLVPFVMEERAIPRQGMPIEGGGEVTSGHPFADARRRDRHGVRANSLRRPRRRARHRRPRQASPRSRREEADLPEGDLAACQQQRAIPTTSAITPSTTGRGSDGDEATLGRHVVRAGRARRARALRGAGGGSTVTKGPVVRRGRVGESSYQKSSRRSPARCST
jgi:aminomethyltransferase